jgi:cell division cycle 2-like protein
MLTYDPAKRITCTEALEHEWFRESPAPKEMELMPTFPAVDDAADKAAKTASAMATSRALAAALKHSGSTGSLSGRGQS